MEFSCRTLLRMGEGYTEYRIPGIVEHKDEAVMCVEARSSTASDWGHIDIMIFGEEGRRHLFVPMGNEQSEGVTPVICPGDTVNNPTLISDGDVLHLVFNVDYKYVLHTTSTDGGRTWTALDEITETYREFPYEWNVCANGPGHGIRLDSGRLVVPIWLANGEEYIANGQMRRQHWPSISGAVYSDDGGSTWHPGAVVRDFDDVIDCNETTCVQLADGSLLFNIRNRGAQHCRVLGISMDGGESCFWAQTDMSLEDPMCFGSMINRGGETYFVNCHTEHDRVNLGVKMLNKGIWEKVAHVDDIGGYADMAAVNEKLWILYERSTPKGIAEIVLAKEK